MSKLLRSTPHSTWKGPALLTMMSPSLPGQETDALGCAGAEVATEATEEVRLGTTEDIAGAEISEDEAEADARLAPQMALFCLGAPRPFFM
jgi:hypothetical protein